MSCTTSRMAPGPAQPSTANGTHGFDHLLPNDEDLLYEEELLRNPYSLKMWWRYLEARRGAEPRRRYILFERALKALPVSYKVRCCCQPLHAPLAVLDIFL